MLCMEEASEGMGVGHLYDLNYMNMDNMACQPERGLAWWPGATG